MPRLIEHIDAIARRKRRDVLYLRFASSDASVKGSRSAGRSNPLRKQVIRWLDDHHIAWESCGSIACETLVEEYMGDIYVDVPFYAANTKFKKLVAYLEHPDGTMKIPGVEFCCLQLSVAMENAHHDVSGFWDRWAETF